MIYRFDDFELDTALLALRCAGVEQPLEPQVLAILELLVANAERVVSKNEIHERVWAGRVVSDAAVNSRIRSARLAIGDDGTAQRLIKTVRNRGFRFAGEVSVASVPVPVSATIEAPLAAAEPEATDLALPTKQANSIAILPLHPVSDGQSAPAPVIADAVAHELIVELSRYRWLHVIARGSSFRFRAQDPDVVAIGNALGVHYVLSGSMRAHGNSVELTFELAETLDGGVVWAETQSVTQADLLSLRSDVANQVAATIESRIQAEEIRRASSRSTENLDAWQSYFRGLWHMYRFNQHDNNIAAALFERALQADPRFARALGGLSFTHFQNAFLGFNANAKLERAEARAKAEQAYALDPLDPFVNLTMGRAEMVNGRWEEAVPWFDRSTELNPSYALAYYQRALSSAVIGDGRVGPDNASKAVALSPLDPLLYAMFSARALCHLAQGDAEAAQQWANRGATTPGAHLHIFAIAYLMSTAAGDAKTAQRWGEKVLQLAPDYSSDRFFNAFPIESTERRRLMAQILDGLT